MNSKIFFGDLVFENNGIADAFFTTALIMADNIAMNIWCGTVQYEGYSNLVGKILLQKNGKSKIITEIYSKVNDSKVAIIRCIEKIDEHLLKSWSQLLGERITNGFIIFDGINLSSIIKMNNYHNKIRKIHNDYFSKEYGDSLLHINHLEVGNIVESYSAALCCYCESHMKPCAILLAMRSSSYTIDAANSFEEVVPFIKTLLDSDTFQLGENSFHRSMIKNDVFLSNTENMYT
jgi:hypothetical protein